MTVDALDSALGHRAMRILIDDVRSNAPLTAGALIGTAVGGLVGGRRSAGNLFTAAGELGEYVDQDQRKDCHPGSDDQGSGNFSGHGGSLKVSVGEYERLLDSAN